MTTCKYAHAISDKVVITATDYPGVVTGLLTDFSGPQYRVVWWNNGERKQDWLYEYEIRGRALEGLRGAEKGHTAPGGCSTWNVND